MTHVRMTHVRKPEPRTNCKIIVPLVYSKPTEEVSNLSYEYLY